MKSILFLSLFLCIAQALQINFSSQERNMSNRDSAQSHYESVLDDILSQHNEGLLTELSMAIKDPHTMYAVLRPQADVLVQGPMEDVCVAQMPGMIANQIHEFSHALYSQVDTIVTDVWKTTDTELRQMILHAINQGSWEQDVLDEIVSSVEFINMEISDRLVAIAHQFDFLGKIRAALLNCQAIFDPHTTSAPQTLTEKIWTAILISFRNPGAFEPNTHGFLNRYIFDLISDLQGELYGRTIELATSIYEDLAFNM
ncbi:uncharacterized protein B0P05DRAFT_549743 [Gilbertella persicaria]|uniref:uncharacterized protein n=1 Tax=Gilbertella persicaria TaxID=101096 RepID=UPI00221E6B1C|nr:uncharacterized protein B0P05DRAFT_549743 [Gilbertella persicaria]KAI8071137.1 hypothetical protein B0P05DRAFT_549743 [Gilbertella persicaria]